jgi:hypothetical protein
MRGTGLQRVNRYAGLAFVAVVTVTLLAFVFGQAERGLAGLPAVVVYAFATGFGLECLASAWTGGWSTRGGLRSSLRRW